MRVSGWFALWFDLFGFCSVACCVCYVGFGVMFMCTLLLGCCARFVDDFVWLVVFSIRCVVLGF